MIFIVTKCTVYTLKVTACQVIQRQYLLQLKATTCLSASHNANQVNRHNMNPPVRTDKLCNLVPGGNCSQLHQSSDKTLSQWESRTEIGISSSSFTKRIILIFMRRFKVAASAWTKKENQTLSKPQGILLLSNNYLRIVQGLCDSMHIRYEK